MLTGPLSPGIPVLQFIQKSGKTVTVAAVQLGMPGASSARHSRALQGARVGISIHRDQ